jgi:transcriptional regulator with XRE-family HTH domain
MKRAAKMKARAPRVHKPYESKTTIRLNGKKLVHLRAGRGWTQAEAAARCKFIDPAKRGISIFCYGSAERGAPLQAAKAGIIAKLYEVPLEQLEVA